MSDTRILFVTSNGTGLGHLTRSLAVARRLGGDIEPLVLTLSAAAPVVRELGFPVEYVASYSTPGAGSDWRWSRRLRGRLRQAVAEIQPRVLVFDGAHPYQALIDSLGAGRRMHRVWCRRPMWQPGSNFGALERTRFFDAVLEPGEFAESEDRGPTVAQRSEVQRVDPIVFLDRDELLPRAEAEQELGLQPGKTNVLVQLGQGEEVRETTDRCLRHLAAREGVQVAALSSAISKLLSVPEDVVHLQATYPISRYYGAFDVVVSAAGYNAYHELIHLGVPSLYVPMRRETDDQPARARYAGEVGVGRGIEAPDSAELEGALDDLLDPARREGMRERLTELAPPNGDTDAALWLEDLAATRVRTRERVPRWRRYLRSPARSVRRAAPFAARMPIHAAALLKQTIVRRPPRTVVLALGVPAGGMEDAVRDALDQTPDPPNRVLVITDSLELAPLLAAGVGFDHVPAPGDREPELAGGDYGEFLRRRLELILAERPRPRRALAVGDADPALAASLARRG
jgi:hypothetical protein